MANRREHVTPEFLPRSGVDWYQHEEGYERNQEAIERAAERFETPFHLFDERGIRNTARRIRDAFSWAPDYWNFFAVKATPTWRILKILEEEGMGADASSGPEIGLAQRAGITGESIMFTSNNTSVEEFERARDAGAIINFDDLSFISFYQRHVGELPDVACLRWNPGNQKEGNAIIGIPEEAKYGLRTDQLVEGYHQLAEGGVRRFGLHTMVASNELGSGYFAETARLLFEQAKRVEAELGITIEFINLGGGFGTAYRPTDRPLELQRTADLIELEYRRAFGDRGPRIVTEMGRLPTGPHGVLVMRPRHLMEKYKSNVGVDADVMATNPRPAAYGAESDGYHHLSVLGKIQGGGRFQKYDVVGSLCENNDKHAIDRELPEISLDDIIVQHNTGAHTRASANNYNGKLRCAEILLTESGEFEVIRRAETEDDLNATQVFGDKKGL